MEQEDAESTALPAAATKTHAACLDSVSLSQFAVLRGARPHGNTTDKLESHLHIPLFFLCRREAAAEKKSKCRGTATRFSLSVIAPWGQAPRWRSFPSLVRQDTARPLNVDRIHAARANPDR